MKLYRVLFFVLLIKLREAAHCPSGTLEMPDEISCGICASGSDSEVGNLSCTACKEGFFSPGDSFQRMLDRRQIVEWPLDSGSTVRVSNKHITKTGDSIDGDFYLDYSTEGGYPVWWLFSPGQSTTGTHFANNQFDVYRYQKYVGSSFNRFDGLSPTDYECEWVSIEFPRYFRVTHSRFIARSSHDFRLPGTFRIYGKNATRSGSANSNPLWYRVHEQTVRLDSGQDVFEYDNPGWYNEYALCVGALYSYDFGTTGDSSAHVLNFVRWKFYGQVDVDGGSMTPLYWNKFAEYDAERGVVPDMMRKYEKPVNFPNQGDTDNYFRKHVWQLAASDITIIARSQNFVTWTMTGQPYLNGRYEAKASSSNYNWPDWHKRMPWGVWVYLEGMDTDGYASPHWKTNRYSTTFTGTLGSSTGDLGDSSYPGDWVTIRFPEPVKASCMQFHVGNGAPQRAPGKFRIAARNRVPNQAWEDGWETVHEQTTTLSYPGDIGRFDFNRPTDFYEEYGIIVSAVGSGGDMLNFRHAHFYQPGKTCLVARSGYEVVKGGGKVFPNVIEENDAIGFTDSYDSATKIWTNTFHLSKQPYMNGKYTVKFIGPSDITWGTPSKVFYKAVTRNWAQYACCQTDSSCSSGCAFTRDDAGALWDESGLLSFSTTTNEFTGTYGCEVDPEYCGAWMTVSLPTRFRIDSHTFVSRTNYFYVRTPGLYRIYCKATWSEEEPWKVMVDARRLHQWVGTSYELQPVAVDKPRFCAQIALVISETYVPNTNANAANFMYWTWTGEPEKHDMDLLPPTTIDALNEDWLTQFQYQGRQWNIPLSGFHESIDGEYVFKGSSDGYGFTLPERVAYCAYLNCRNAAGAERIDNYLGRQSRYDINTLLYIGDDELTGEFSGGEWTSVRFPSPVKVMKLTVVLSYWGPRWSPTLFYFVGRNDTGNWALVHEQTSELEWSVVLEDRTNFENEIWVDFPNIFQEYAFVCLKIEGPTSGGTTDGRCGYRLKMKGQLGEPTVRVRSMAGFGAGGSVVDALFGTHAVGLATWPYATDQMFWPLNSVQASYTLCASARYTSKIAEFNHRIIGATSPANIVLGHLNNGYARVHSTAYLDSTSEASADVKDNWLLLCGVGGKAHPYNVITEQATTGTATVSWNSNAQLAINAYNENNVGHWAVHEVIAFDHQLTSTEAKSVTAFLRNELQKGGEACSTCPAASQSGSGSHTCAACPSTQVSSGGEACRFCGSGSYPDTTNTECVFPDAGRYSTASGSSACAAHTHIDGSLGAIDSNLTMHLPFDVTVAARPESKVPNPAIWLKFDDVGDPGKDSSGNGRHGFTSGYHRYFSSNRGGSFNNYRMGGANSNLPNITTSDRRDGLGAARFIPGNWVTLPPFEPRGGGFSVSFWFKSEVRDTPGAHTLVEMREHMGAYTGRLYLGRKDDAQGFWVYRRTADDTGWHATGEVPPYEDGAWTFAGVTWRSDGNAFLMLNSTWYAIGNSGGGAAPLYRHFEIGRFLNTEGSPAYIAILDEEYWDGLLDDFRVFDVELGAEDFHAIRLEASPGESFDRLRSADEAVVGVDFPNNQGENPTMMTRTDDERSLEYLAPYVYIYAPMTSSIKDESQYAVAVADTTKVPTSFTLSDVVGVNAAVFSGSQYVEFGEPGNPAPHSINVPKVITGPDQSFSFWFKRDAFRSEILFHVSSYQTQANGLLKLAMVGGSLQLQYSDCWNIYRTENVCSDVWSVDAQISGMQWHHIVVTRSRVGRVIIHCDGYEDYAASWDMNCGGNPAYFYVFVIGAQKTVNQNSFSSYFQGQIRDFIYFTTTLDSADVKRLYEQGSNYEQFRRVQDRRFPMVTDQQLMSGEFMIDSSGSQDSQARPECVWFGCQDNYAGNRFSRWQIPNPYDSSGLFIPGSGMELGGYEGEWVSIRAPYRFKIRSMVITMRPSGNPPPGSWVLLARNGLEDWVVLYEQRERIDRGALTSYDWVDTESFIALEKQDYFQEYGVVMLSLQSSSNTGNTRPNVRRIYFTGATLRDGEKFLLADSSVTSIPGKELLSRGGGDGRLDFAALRGVKGLTVSLWARVLVSQLRFPSPPVLAFRDFKNGESLLLRDSVQDGFQLVVSVRDVAVKLCASCLLQTSSKVSIFKCWGRNTYGELGLGDIVHRGNAAGQMGSALPYVQLANQHIDPVVEISGQYSKCALRLSGTIECWGYGGYGALGSGSTTSVRDAASPQRVDLGTGRLARQIVTGFNHHCALLRENAHVVRWPPIGSVVDSSGALQGSLTISNAGPMSGDYGVAWTSVYNNNHLPHLLFHPWDGSTTEDAHWASGQYTGGIYQKSADLTGTGYLGDGLSISLPRAFKMTNFKFRARSSLFMTRLPGRFKIFGRNKDTDVWQVIHDQSESLLTLLGSGDLLYIAANIAEPRYFLQYAFVVAELYGSDYIMNFRSWEWEGLPDAGVVCWGRGDRGMVGNGKSNDIGNDPDEMGDNLIPVVGLPGDISSIFSTGYSTCAILRYSGEVFCWGEGSDYGELGIGPAADQNTATTAALLGTSFRAQFGHGSNRHWCVVDQFGRAKCVGRNDIGQCGLGYTSSGVGLSSSTLGDNLPFVKFAGSSARVVQLGSGDQEMIALLSDGTVWVWGQTQGGSSGQGSGSNQYSPVQVAVSSQIQVKSLDSSRLNQNSFCVLLENLQVKCWGDGFYGATGIGSTADIGDQANEMDEFLPVVDLDFRLDGDGVQTTVVGLGHGEHISFQLRDDGSILHGDSDLLLQIDFEGDGGDSTGSFPLLYGDVRVVQRLDDGALLDRLTMDSLDDGGRYFGIGSPGTTDGLSVLPEPTIVPGIVGVGALEFNDKQNFYSTHASLIGGTEYSMAMWIRRANYERESWIWKTNHRFRLTSSGILQAFVDGSYLQFTRVFEINVWYHVVYQWRFDNHYLFVNGNYDSELSFTSSAIQKFQIGYYTSLTSWPNYRGAMDDVRIYNRMLSDAEISALYRSSVPVLASTDVATTTMDKRMGQRAGKFNGVSSKVSLDAPLRLTKDISFSVWFKEEGPQVSWAKIFALYTSASTWDSNDRILLSKNGNLNQYLFEMRRSSSVKQWKFDVESGEWHFFCISLRADGTWVIFHNGEVVVLENYWPPDTTLTYASVRVGVHAFDNNLNPFSGLIDHFTVHSRALSPAEMADLYMEGQTLGHVQGFEEARDWEVSVLEDAGHSSLNDGLVLDVSFDDGTLNSRVAVPSFPTGVRKDMGEPGSVVPTDLDLVNHVVTMPDGRTVRWGSYPQVDWASSQNPYDISKVGPWCVFMDTHCDNNWAHFTQNAFSNFVYVKTSTLDGEYFGDWVSVTYPHQLKVTHLTIQSRSGDHGLRAPGKFRLYGRAGQGVSWELIAERSDKSKAYVSDHLELDLYSDKFFSEFAIVVSEMQGSGTHSYGNYALSFQQLFLHGHRKYGSANNRLISNAAGYSFEGPGREGEKYFESVGGVLTAGDDENPILPPDALGLSVSMWLHAVETSWPWPIAFSKPFASQRDYMWLHSFFSPDSPDPLDWYVYLNQTDQPAQRVCRAYNSQESYPQRFHYEKWNHLTITWDFMGGIVSMYVNGVHVTTCTGAEIAPSYLGWSSVVFLGYQLSSGSTGNKFPAGTKVDELKVWSRALSEAEVGLVCPPELRSLVLSLPFDRSDDLVREMHRDLLFYLPLDGDFSDHSGNEKRDPLNSANLPTLTGSEGSTVTEKTAYFDGSSKCIELPGFTEPSAGLAVVYWFKPWKRGGNLDILVHFVEVPGVGTNFVMIQQTSTSADTLRVRLTCSGNQQYMFAIPYTINAWQHHVFQWNPDGTTKFYVDGVLHSSAYTNGYCGPSSSILYQSHRLGCNFASANGYHFPAYVDEYRVYNRSLTDEEVYALYLHRLGSAKADIARPQRVWACCYAV